MSVNEKETSHPIHTSRTLILDTETTGIAHELGHKIIEIGIIELEKGVETGNNFHVYLDPEREVDEGAEAVHGLDWENLVILSEGKKFKDIAYDLTNYLKGAFVVAHNSSFDFGHIDAEFRRLGLPEISHQVKISDSLKLANNLYPGRRNNLDSLSKRLHVDLSKRELHGALIDAAILSEVYIKLVKKQEELGLSNKQESSSDISIDGINKVKFTPVNESFSNKLRSITLTEKDLKAHDEMVKIVQKSSGDEGFSF